MRASFLLLIQIRRTFIAMDMIEVYNIILMILGIVLFILRILTYEIIRNYGKINRQNNILTKELNQQDEKGKVISITNYSCAEKQKEKL